MTQIYVCGNEFTTPDGVTPNYSLVEIDLFAFIPAGYYQRKGITPQDEPSFNLSLRKNLLTNHYEIFQWHRADDESTKKVMYATLNLKTAILRATKLWHKYWDNLGDTPNSDFTLKLCKHKYPHRSITCRENTEKNTHSIPTTTDSSKPIG